MEILQETLLHLPSANVVNLKLASSTFAAVPLTQRFGLPSFSKALNATLSSKQDKVARKIVAGEHYTWMLDGSKATVTLETDASFGIISLGLKASLGVYRLPPPSEGSPLRSLFDKYAPDNDLTWGFASGDVKKPVYDFDYGCRLLFMRTLPSSVLCITAAWCGLG
ncbi:hypothetical protein VTN00DRAFT_5166 [Thermoascus crustaceus]|uniref:uncharacterized protein n=1 Tax=Thermoascus crustaceus TaxID=5088 RepID=UPI003744648F